MCVQVKVTKGLAPGEAACLACAEPAERTSSVSGSADAYDDERKGWALVGAFSLDRNITGIRDATSGGVLARGLDEAVFLAERVVGGCGYHFHYYCDLSFDLTSTLCQVPWSRQGPCSLVSAVIVSFDAPTSLRHACTP